MRFWRWSLLILAALSFGLAAWLWLPNQTEARGCAKHNNAAWLDVDWTSQPVNQAKVAALASSLRARRITTVFPYASYFRARDQAFTNSYRYAPEFIAALHHHAPEVQVLAWVGVALEPWRAFGGTRGVLRLQDATDRARISQVVTTLLAMPGWAGVHLDIETVRTGNPDFLVLLGALRSSLPRGKILSVAGHAWVSDAVLHLPFGDYLGWSGGYIREVARHVDQLAVMTYDSAMPFPGAYRAWMRDQTRAQSRALEGLPTELLIGISVSREATASHNPWAESLEAGLAGYCAAGVDRANGIAVYANWDWNAQHTGVWQRWLER